MSIGTGDPAPVTRTGDPRKRFRGGAVALIAALIVAAGVAGAIVITSQDEDTSPTGASTPVTTASPPATPADPQAATKAAVLDAYRKSWDDFLAVGRDLAAKPDDPRLEAHATDAALIAEQRSLTRHKANGQILVGDVELHPSVIEVTADKATVVDCNIDRTRALQVSTGKEEVLPGPEASAVTATLVLEDGAWKVSTFKDEQRSCVPPAT